MRHRARTVRATPATALVVEGFFSRLAFGLLTFALPLYAHRMGMSLTQIGLLTSASVVVSMLLKPVLGPWADRWGLRRSLLGALALRAVVCLAYVATAAPWQLFGVRGVHGVSDAVRDPAVHALIAENGGKKAIATTFAWYQTAKTTAGAVGKSVAGLLLATAGGFTLTFATAFALSLLPLLAVWVLVPRGSAHPRSADPPAPPPPPPGPTVASVPPARGLAAYAGLGFLVAGTSAMLTALFPVLAVEYAGLSTAQAGLLYLLTPAFAFTGPLWGWVADHVSRRLVLAVRSVSNICSAALYLLFPGLVGMWVGKSLDDIGKAAFRPAWGSLMAEVSDRDPRTRARTMAYLTSGEDAGDVVAPVVAGLIWTAWGVPALLVARMVAAVVTEVYAARLERATRPATRLHPDPTADGGRARASSSIGRAADF